MLPRENSWRSQRTKICISWEVAPAATELGLRTSRIYDALVLWYNINSHFCPPWWLWFFLSCVSLGRYAMYLDIFPDGKRKLCHYGRFLGVETRFSSPLFSIRYEPNNSSCNWSIKTMTFRVIIFFPFQSVDGSGLQVSEQKCQNNLGLGRAVQLASNQSWQSMFESCWGISEAHLWLIEALRKAQALTSALWVSYLM